MYYNILPRHYEKKEGTRRIMYRQDYIARAMIDVQDIDVDPGKSVSLKDLQDASTSGNNQRETPQEEIQDLLELPDLEESFDETSSEFNIVKFQQGKLKPYFYVGKALNQIDDKEKVKFLRKAERGKHNENEIAFKDP
ncbi:hypothetical protein Avbf_02964 [Armadillidium vulgare]|nr:hypothetical protein Avbf_02964 [Armadillidium vulgare]